jgi:protein-S-isoprenylcysteine O-methyltransferase Ste14
MGETFVQREPIPLGHRRGLLLVLVGAYFIYSARRDETIMLQLFPEQYAAYMARTGMLAPCPFGLRDR